MERQYCPYCKELNMEEAAHCASCGRPIVPAALAAALPVTGLARRRVLRPLREPMEERLVWALAISLATLLGIAALLNFPAPVGVLLSGLLLAVAAAGVIYRWRRCDMFARRRARLAGGSARPGTLILWGWAYLLLLLLPGWVPGTPPEVVPALIGGGVAGLLVLDEWRGLLLAGGCAAAFGGAYFALARLMPGLLASARAGALLALILWFAAVWLSETHRQPD
jgi:hypothetical protein